ncbi:IPT/TIG domain-containing protein [Nocardia sp. NPDC050630]|uniref:IPT/TIG domain-containing protein n=1 Tax=Nocardia sp. NPDC050630 TaxID=3364321 RepID=UPI0037B3B428
MHTAHPLDRHGGTIIPTITAVSPSSGPASGGNPVVITGTWFTGPTTLRSVTTATVFTIDSDTQITAIAPPETGTVQVIISNTGETSNGATYTYVTVPSSTSHAPITGPTADGTTVTLTGTGLTYA